MNAQKLTALTLAITMLGSTSSPVSAVSTPTFPACTAPQGTIKAQYNEGVHGIVGNTGRFEGKDTVYQLDQNEQLVQCFCPTNGNEGIQTNWWQVSNLSDDEIKVLQSQGWIYVVNGLAWGLNDAPYVAKNSTFACNTSGPQVQGATTGNNGGSGSSSSSSSSSNSSSSDSSGLGGVGSVLAQTGNSLALIGTLLVGVVSLSTGLLLRRRA